MKVRMTITVDLSKENVENWCEAYLIDSSEFREDFKEHIRNLIQQGCPPWGGSDEEIPTVRIS